MAVAAAYRSFEERGYARLEGCLDEATCAAMRCALDRLARPESLGHDERFYDNKDEVRGAGDGAHLTAFGTHQWRLNNVQQRDPLFHQLIDHPRILPFLKGYMRKPRLAGDWHIRKDCGPRSSWWHRGTGSDGYIVDVRSGQRFTKQLNVAWLLDDQAAGEGCLLALPGSHLKDFDGDTFNRISIDFPGLSLPGSVPVEGKAGDVIVFTESLLHCGDEKRSGGIRRNLYMLYSDDSVEDVVCSTQHKLELRCPSASAVGSLWPYLCREQQRQLCGVATVNTPRL